MNIFDKSFIDDIVLNAKSAASTVGIKANQIKEYSKLRYAESGIKGEIAKKKQQLGDYIYAGSKSGVMDKDAVSKFVAEIDELEENVQITKEMITAAKNKITCEFCKAENDKSAAYCNKCGKELKKETVAENVKEEDVTEEDVTVAVVEEAEEKAEEKTEVATEEATEEKSCCEGGCCSFTNSEAADDAPAEEAKTEDAE